ncbi:MAG: 6-phosphofructokinase [Planctomycetes bacterium GWF2_41_51]|nr:MAG: 6-phosphofructokinase [Planctomycetes bacterium GWF2_41_51]
MAKVKTIAVMTGGGDCPGLNAVIRAVTKTAIAQYGIKVWGIEDGFLGIIENRIRPLGYREVSNILETGGTILGSNNTTNPSKYPHTNKAGKVEFKDLTASCVRTLKQKKIDALVCIGGDGTMTSAEKLAERGMTIIGVPKTIDNDLWGTEVTFGFDTAVTTATEAIDKLRTTASAHHRIMVLEVMGRYAGWIALHAGVAGGADVILIPEIPYSLDKVCDFIKQRNSWGKTYTIICVAEGAKEIGGEMVVRRTVAYSPETIRLGGIANKLAGQIEMSLGLETRSVTLGYVQRGGRPTAHDRVLATSFGHAALELVVSGKKNRLVVWKNNQVSSVPLAQVAGKVRKVPVNSPLIAAARGVNTCFGD